MALRIVLGFALLIEALGLGYGIAPLGPVVRDAFHAGSGRIVVGTLVFVASVCAIHLVVTGLVLAASLSARRAPLLSAIVALAPIALASLGFRSPIGYSVAIRDIRLEGDAPLALLEAAVVHVMLAAFACVIVLLAIPFGVIRRGGTEDRHRASNGEVL